MNANKKKLSQLFEQLGGRWSQYKDQFSIRLEWDSNLKLKYNTDYKYLSDLIIRNDEINFWITIEGFYDFKSIPHIGNKEYTEFHLNIKQPLGIIWNLFQDKKEIDFFNELNIISSSFPGEKPILILERLNTFLDELKKPRPNSYRIKKIKEFYDVVK